MPKKQATEHLKIAGTFRADRHDKRDRVAQTDDDPKPMAPLEGEALKAWQAIVPPLVELGAVSSLDSCELTALCEWWAEYRKWADDDLQNAYKCTVAAAMAYKQFRTLASKFYLTPSDRIGMPCGLQTMSHVRRRTHEAANDCELEDMMR